MTMAPSIIAPIAIANPQATAGAFCNGKFGFRPRHELRGFAIRQAIRSARADWDALFANFCCECSIRRAAEEMTGVTREAIMRLAKNRC
jgi:hypothetical protein